MIAFVVGTTAELIKIAPVFHACQARGREPALWFTGQHVADVPELLDRLGLPEPTRWLARGVTGQDLQRPKDVPRWLSAVTGSVWRERRALRAELAADGCLPLVVVHGDTFTTVVGAVLGRLLGARVAHVEAGLRSGSLRSPFPEEGNRRIVGRLVDLHFPPTPREVANLRGHRGAVVLTGANTVLDSLKLLAAADPHQLPLPARYGVATLHRFELMQDRPSLTAVLRLLHEAARDLPILLFAGAPERDRFARYDLLDLFDNALVLRDKLAYLDFLPVLGAAEFVVTDSGGLQEECAYLGVPCVVHRKQTERHQGLGGNVVLSGMDLEVVRGFLADPAALRGPSTLEQHQPSQVIVDALATMGHL